MKYIIISCVLWLGAWVFVIICNMIFASSIKKKMSKSKEDWEHGMLLSLYQKQSAEIIEDGNSMFKNGIVYAIATVACVYIGNDIVRWIIVAICGVACLPSIFYSFAVMIPQAVKMMFIGTTLMAATALVTSLSQGGMVAVMALAILYP